MPTKSEEYERLIADFVEDIRNSGRKIKSPKSGKKNLHQGRSGQKHQIDVSFIDYSFNKPKFVLIECKRWKNRVDVSACKVLKYNKDDICVNQEHPPDRLMILVSPLGFQSGAKIIAHHEKIKLEIVNPEPPTGFSYADIIQAVINDDVKVTEVVNIEISL